MGELIGIHQQYSAMPAYVAHPSEEQRREQHGGGIVLLHDEWGLSDHVKSVADKLAAHGYDVLAPSLLHATGVDKLLTSDLRSELYNPSMRQRNMAAPRYRSVTAPLQMPQLAAQLLGRVHSSFEYMYNQPQLRQNVAIIGFGLGATQAFELTVRDSRVRCLVSFYGQAPRVSQMLQHIRCPILGIYAGKDPSQGSEASKLGQVLGYVGADFEPHMYEGALPGFFDETSPLTYDGYAANDSWQRTLGFLQRCMSGARY